MPRTVPPLLPRVRRLLVGLGERIHAARLRRSLSAGLAAERAGISRKTLQRVERGDPAVALGIYARVLQALRLENDLEAIASDDQLGRRLQDAQLPRRVARRNAASKPPSEEPP
jgi:transcriptional regulator with XRE-family HTH domain